MGAHPQHAHILLRTGQTPLATVMRRLLTGYAVSYNRRHRRHGHLFQNRYKSILCQEDTYLLELTRYIHLSDERILGDGDFTQSVLDEAKERLEERYRLQAQGYDLEKVTIRVSSELGIDPEQVWAAGKHRITVKAGSLMCYWAVRRLGISTTELSKKLGVSQP
ncbi:MAG: hypothetical protein GY743_09995, partial [Planctomycetaceae bacterium]|nr:hypothetical protein [Planctomycetaceae bacterium]